MHFLAALQLGNHIHQTKQRPPPPGAQCARTTTRPCPWTRRCPRRRRARLRRPRRIDQRLIIHLVFFFFARVLRLYCLYFCLCFAVVYLVSWIVHRRIARISDYQRKKEKWTKTNERKRLADDIRNERNVPFSKTPLDATRKGRDGPRVDRALNMRFLEAGSMNIGVADSG